MPRMAEPIIREATGGRVGEQLNADGYAHLGRLLSASAIASLTELYRVPDAFRSRVVMQRHGFGLGEYQYFAYPLPKAVSSLRRELYRVLAPIANDWNDKLGLAPRYPPSHGGFIRLCREAGQTRPTPLILRYEEGDYNRLHQDLYGEIAFPIQVVILLSDPGDFDGGEFVLTEQRPRMQSRATVVPLEPGHGVAFAVNERPQRGSRGYYRVKHRHGVSVVRRGDRYTLGIIFHDAS